MPYMTVLGIYRGVHFFCQALTVLLCAYALMTWFVRPDAPIYRLSYRLCQPIVAPFRPIGQKLIEAGLRVDLSVWLAVIAIRLLDRLLLRLLHMLL